MPIYSLSHVHGKYTYHADAHIPTHTPRGVPSQHGTPNGDGSPNQQISKQPVSTVDYCGVLWRACKVPLVGHAQSLLCLCHYLVLITTPAGCLTITTYNSRYIVNYPHILDNQPLWWYCYSRRVARSAHNAYPRSVGPKNEGSLTQLEQPEGLTSRA